MGYENGVPTYQRGRWNDGFLALTIKDPDTGDSIWVPGFYLRFQKWALQTADGMSLSSTEIAVRLPREQDQRRSISSAHASWTAPMVWNGGSRPPHSTT